MSAAWFTNNSDLFSAAGKACGGFFLPMMSLNAKTQFMFSGIFLPKINTICTYSAYKYWQLYNYCVLYCKKVTFETESALIAWCIFLPHGL